MSDNIGIGLLIVLSVIVLIGVVLTAGAVFVILKYRLPARGIAATLGGLLYVLSPVDAISEVPLGPIGLIDDAAVIIATLVYIHRLVSSRGGEPVPLPGSPPESPGPT